MPARSTQKPAPAEYLPIPEVAALTRMSEAFWWKQLRLRKIPHVKLGAAVRIRRATLTEWMASREVGGD
jgi:excisionase family DNA binding protein